MKKLILAALLFSIASGTQVAHAEEVSSTDNAETYVSFVSYDFKNYPPSTYAGKTLVKVEKISMGYRGWYL
ncbi:hypothetical protein [Enterococcus saccharolyticus]|uniref:Uncharacterized protein n=1 Tax=Enterococcus saccharolyticus subsp. saccharolyticus ATCC 43076 TaxID=1139996 RepID=S0JE11_9ENTE|nr:hypothetical protein [Enterococcus saccharolyticus]EOT25948.1 hypothetical protein OMQ_02418 [Enterococcus saccharolyticus subsp. saccharolyticus ATCC 43076]EOT82684.1 hypothetical protein I572_00224 [Enterococcus saccharolyticus subsp. saccharolyticus ATCC 43076]